MSHPTHKVTTHTVDAEGKVLGRLATEIATLLRGKNKVGFTFHQDHGDKVVVTNADKIVVTGKKETDKMYYRHSSYPGGLKSTNLATLRASKPDEIILQAVKNMLPDNRLRPIWLKRLVITKSENNG